MVIREVDAGENLCTINILTFIQAVCIGIILLCTYTSFLYMPFGDAMTIIFTAPVFTMVLSRIFLEDACKVHKYISAIFLFAGVTLVLQPPVIFGQRETITNGSGTNTKENNKYYFGATMAFSSSIAGAFHIVIVGRLFKNSTTHSAFLLAFYGGLGALLSALPAAFLNHGQHLFSASIASIPKTTWAALFAVASLGIIGFVAVNLAIKKTNPVFSSFVASIEIVFAYVAQIVVFGMMPDALGIVGSIIVVVVVCSLPFMERLSEKSNIGTKKL